LPIRLGIAETLAGITRFPQAAAVIRFAVLGSGSGGNSSVVECGGVRLLIDAGLSAKQLCLRLAKLGIRPEQLDGILLTHEHGDHVRGLEVFLKKHPVPVYTTPATRRVMAIEGLSGGVWKTFETAQTFTIGAAVIQSFTVHHDAVDPVGFVISHDARQLGVVSDAGHVTRSMTDCLHKLDSLFVEANYDDELLAADTKRPWSTKQRISSRHGHLSNEQVSALLGEIAHPGLGRVVLGHLSSDCNKPEIVLQRLRRDLGKLGHHHIDLHCAGQDEPTDWFSVA
jgi:phosphoribosyl 1,2-cyclic phosphodiesterase